MAPNLAAFDSLPPVIATLSLRRRAALIGVCWSVLGGLSAQGVGTLSFEARYLVAAGGLEIGSATVALDCEEDRYRYSSHSRITGVAAWLTKGDVVQESRGELRGLEVRPLRYRYERRGRGGDRTSKLVFDWARQRAEERTGEQHRALDVEAGTLDKLSVDLAAMLDLMSGKRRMEYVVADHGRLRKYRYQVIGEETVHVLAGTFDTLKLERVRLGKDTRILVWVAPEIDYLPVRIEQHKGMGLAVTSELERYALGLAQ